MSENGSSNGSKDGGNCEVNKGNLSATNQAYIGSEGEKGTDSNTNKNATRISSGDRSASNNGQ